MANGAQWWTPEQAQKYLDIARKDGVVRKDPVADLEKMMKVRPDSVSGGRFSGYTNNPKQPK